MWSDGRTRDLARTNRRPKRFTSAEHARRPAGTALVEVSHSTDADGTRRLDRRAERTLVDEQGRSATLQETHQAVVAAPGALSPATLAHIEELIEARVEARVEARLETRVEACLALRLEKTLRDLRTDFQRDLQEKLSRSTRDARTELDLVRDRADLAMRRSSIANGKAITARVDVKALQDALENALDPISRKASSGFDLANAALTQLADIGIDHRVHREAQDAFDRRILDLELGVDKLTRARDAEAARDAQPALPALPALPAPPTEASELAEVARHVFYDRSHSDDPFGSTHGTHVIRVMDIEYGLDRVFDISRFRPESITYDAPTDSYSLKRSVAKACLLHAVNTFGFKRQRIMPLQLEPGKPLGVRCFRLGDAPTA